MNLDDWRPSVKDIHDMEQQWPMASEQLSRELEVLRAGIPELEKQFGLSGPTITFAYMRGFLLKSRLQYGMGAVMDTEIMCAAAFAELTRATRAEDDMSPFERKYEE